MFIDFSIYLNTINQKIASELTSEQAKELPTGEDFRKLIWTFYKKEMLIEDVMKKLLGK